MLMLSEVCFMHTVNSMCDELTLAGYQVPRKATMSLTSTKQGIEKYNEKLMD